MAPLAMWHPWAVFLLSREDPRHRQLRPRVGFVLEWVIDAFPAALLAAGELDAVDGLLTDVVVDARVGSHDATATSVPSARQLCEGHTTMNVPS